MPKSTNTHTEISANPSEFEMTSRQPNTSVIAQDDKGDTALHCAIKESNTDEISRLLENGADIHAVDQEGNTPLHYAGYAGIGGVFSSLATDDYFYRIIDITDFLTTDTTSTN